MYYIFEEKWGCNIISVKTQTDHIHILFEAPPQVCLANLINNFKTVSSRRIRKEYAEYLKQYYWKTIIFGTALII